MISIKPKSDGQELYEAKRQTALDYYIESHDFMSKTNAPQGPSIFVLTDLFNAQRYVIVGKKVDITVEGSDAFHVAKRIDELVNENRW